MTITDIGSLGKIARQSNDDLAYCNKSTSGTSEETRRRLSRRVCTVASAKGVQRIFANRTVHFPDAASGNVAASQDMDSLGVSEGGGLIATGNPRGLS